MKRLSIFCLVCLCTQICVAQYWRFEEPDYHKIEKAVGDPHSMLYYPRLLKRFQKADTTLSLKEKRHLYYGFVFHPDYAPNKTTKGPDSLELILTKTDHDQNDLEKIVLLGDKILHSNPFDLEVMNYQLYALENLQDSAEYNAVAAKMDMIYQTLLSSGDGTSKETAFYVIDPAHEHQLLYILGLKFGENQRLIGQYDYLELAANDIGLEGLYFDISPCLNTRPHVLGKK